FKQSVVCGGVWRTARAGNTGRATGGLDPVNSLGRNLCAPVTCVIGRSPLCELLHPRRVGQHDGRIQMNKTTGLFAASAAALILACVVGWAVSDTQARVAAPA